MHHKSFFVVVINFQMYFSFFFFCFWNLKSVSLTDLKNTDVNFSIRKKESRKQRVKLVIFLLTPVYSIPSIVTFRNHRWKIEQDVRRGKKINDMETLECNFMLDILHDLSPWFINNTHAIHMYLLCLDS